MLRLSFGDPAAKPASTELMPSIRRPTQEDYDIAEPRASALIESLRAFGHNIQTAIADLIDNSISAEAKSVWLTFFWDGFDSYVSTGNDGRGMSEKELGRICKVQM